MLKIEHLYKSFGRVIAAEDVSLHVAAGETVVLMGPSGCGKSTTIRTINRLVKPDKGRIWVGGFEVTAMDETGLNTVRRSIGFVFQHFNLIQRLTALENTMLALVTGNMPFEKARLQALEALCKVGIEGHAE